MIGVSTCYNNWVDKGGTELSSLMMVYPRTYRVLQVVITQKMKLQYLFEMASFPTKVSK